MPTAKKVSQKEKDKLVVNPEVNPDSLRNAGFAGSPLSTPFFQIGNYGSNTLGNFASDGYVQEIENARRQFLATGFGGHTGTNIFGGFPSEDNYIKELTNNAQRCRMFDEMRHNHWLISAIMNYFELLICNAEWDIEDKGDGKCETVASMFNDMTKSFSEVKQDIISFIWQGYSVLFPQYKVRRAYNQDPKRDSLYNDNLIAPSQIPIRLQKTFYRFLFDIEGQLTGFQQIAPVVGTVSTFSRQDALLFRTTSLGDLPLGRSILRGVYWAYLQQKYLITTEGVSYSKNMTGIPLLKIPLTEFNNPNKVKMWSQYMATISKNAYSGFILPDIGKNNDQLNMGNYDFTVVNQSINTYARDINDSIIRYDLFIAKAMLGDFLELSSFGSNSNTEATIQKKQYFIDNVNYYLFLIDKEINKFITKIYRLNGWNPTKKCVFKHRKVNSLTEREYLNSLVLAINSLNVKISDKDYSYIRQKLSLSPKNEGFSNPNSNPSPSNNTPKK